MEWTNIAVLIVLGLVLIAVDFYLPGFVLGTVGVGLMLLALGICYTAHGLDATLVLFVVEVALGIGVGLASMKYFPKTALGKKMILSHEQKNVRASETHDSELVGREGVAQTVLRPA